MPPKAKSIAGQKFGMLTVLNDFKSIKSDTKGKSYIYWLCQCECGSVKYRRYDGLKNSKSCGCVNRAGKSGTYSHGETKSPLHRRWCGIRSRCFSKNNCNYHKYGAKGITMCKEWVDDYTKFRDWSLQNGFKEGLSIDRIDVYGNYEPSNCRWATYTEQACNTSRNVNLTYQGVTKIASHWDDFLGYSRGAVGKQIKAGKTIDEIINYKLKE